MPKANQSFEELWRIYINGPKDGDDFQIFTLGACYKAATTFNEFAQIFHATMSTLNTVQYCSLGSARVGSLKAMIRLASNEKEARRAFNEASKKKRDGKYYFPTRVKEAKAKLETFQKAA